MAKCDNCGKGTSFGHNVSHSKHRTNRPWRANVQRTTIVVEGRNRQVNMCTRCLRTLTKLV